MRSSGSGAQRRTEEKRKRDGDQFLMHRVQAESEFFKRRDTEQRSSLIWAKDHDGGSLPGTNGKSSISDRPGDVAAVGKRKGPFAMWCDPEGLQSPRRDDRIHGSRIHEKFNLEVLTGLTQVEH